MPFDDPAVLVDAATCDDAAVYRLGPDRALVATVDFFTPIVDDAYAFGRIAAANALSDVYAMGARPLFALNLLGFPRGALLDGELEAIVRGGGDAAREAQIAVLGGHSIDDPEPKFGMCVIGEVHPDRIVRNSTGRVGDVLVLTKAIGTGVITTAFKKDPAIAVPLRAATESMSALNRAASEAMVEVGVHAATDVTGYGLIGHLREMTAGAGLGARIRAGAVPLLEGARELAEAGHIPGGTRRNREDTAAAVTWAADTPEVLRWLFCDAQTSGGLLIAVPAERAGALLAAIELRGQRAARIGELVDAAGGTIHVEA